MRDAQGATMSNESDHETGDRRAAAAQEKIKCASYRALAAVAVRRKDGSLDQAPQQRQELPAAMCRSASVGMRSPTSGAAKDRSMAEPGRRTCCLRGHNNSSLRNPPFYNSNSAVRHTSPGPTLLLRRSMLRLAQQPDNRSLRSAAARSPGRREVEVGTWLPWKQPYHALSPSAARTSRALRSQ